MMIGTTKVSPRTDIVVSRTVNCPFSIAQEYAEEYFRAAEAGGAESLVHVPWPAPLPSLEHRVALTFGVHLDIAEPGRAHDEIRFHWTSGSPMLPNFAGTVRFRIAGQGTCLSIQGGYTAPLGLLGRIVDFLIGRRVAFLSVADLAARLDRHLSSRQLAWAVLHPALVA